MPANFSSSLPGHVDRARALFAEDFWFGFAVNEAWADEDDPDEVDPTQWTLGVIKDETYSGATLDEDNAFATLRTRVSTGVGGDDTVQTIRVRGLASPANRYEVVRMPAETVLATGLQGSATPNTTAVPGVSLTVTATTITAGHYYEFVLDGPLGFQLADIKHMVVPDDDSDDLVWNGQNWRIVDEADAQVEGARWVYVGGTLAGADLVLKNYRQIALTSGLVRADEVDENATSLTPTEVEDVGVIQMIEHMEKIVRGEESDEVYVHVIET